MRSERAVTNGVNVGRKLYSMSKVPVYHSKGVYFSCISDEVIFTCNLMHKTVADVVEVINKVL